MKTLVELLGLPRVGRRRRRNGRGTVLIFVVAMLALLAIMGTAYLLSARLERGNVRIESEAIDMDYARDSVLNMVREITFDCATDSNGSVLNYLPSNPANTAKARYYDYPDYNNTGKSSNVNDTNVPDEEWLTGYSFGASSKTVTQTSLLTPKGFDPANGKYDIGMPTQNAAVVDPYNPTNDGTFQLLSNSTPAGVRFRVALVIEDSEMRANLNTGTFYSGPSDPQLVGGGSDAWGHAYPANTADKLMPYGAYLTGVYLCSPSIFNGTGTTSLSGFSGISDNPGYIHFVYPPQYTSNSPPFVPDGVQDGHYLWGRYAEFGSNGIHDWNTHVTDPSAPGPAGAAACPYNQPSWQQRILTMECPNYAGSAPIVTTPNGQTSTLGQVPDWNCNFYELTDEMELRSFGIRGANNLCRPAAVWPNTLGEYAPTRDYYTVYSWTRNFRVSPDPVLATPLAATTYAPGLTAAPPPGGSNIPFTFNGGKTTITPDVNGGYWATLPTVPVWPAAPRKIGLNSVFGSPVPSALGNANLANQTQPGTLSTQTLAVNATNFATAMIACGYSQQEAISFAVNYMTYMNEQGYGWTALPGLAGPAVGITNGPAWIDANGINIPTSGGAYTTYSSSGASDLKAKSGYIYVGYMAQPFLNEVAVHMKAASTVDDWAIELANPYQQDLDLSNFRLYSAGVYFYLSGIIPAASGNTPSSTPGLSAVYGTASGVTDSLATGASTKINVPTTAVLPNTATSTTLITGAGGVIELQRKLANGTWVSVDALNYAQAVTEPSGSDGDVYRMGHDASGDSLWACTNGTTALSTSPTIGAVNGFNAAFSGKVCAPLYDRYVDNTQPLAPITQGGGRLYNITDFNRIGRVTNIVISAGTYAAGPPGGSLSAQIAGLSNSFGNAPPALAPDAQVHFDFLTTGSTADDVSPSAITVSGISYPGGTPRALRLLDYIDPTDRASDPTISISPRDGALSQLSTPVIVDAMGATDLNKVRLPGRINVNTASPQVLEAIPGVTPAIASAIVSYRNTNHGIRSLGELLYVVSQVSAPTPTSIDNRDSAWGEMANVCTTRSDTFIVYGYMEALKANLNANPTTGVVPSNNNGSDWYNGTVTDDSTNTTAQFIRVAKRRFFAVVDRSWSNYPRTTNTTWVASPPGKYYGGETVMYNNQMYICTQNALVPPASITAPSSNPNYFTPVTFQLPVVVALKDLPY